MEHIATGVLLRAAIESRTQAGQAVQPYLESGRLVPDTLVNDLIAERFAAHNRPTSFVMDGYPRTLSQGRAFDGILRAHGLDLTAVILLQVRDEEIIARLPGRLICPNPECNANYHLSAKPPETEGVCDRCGTPLRRRADDNLNTIRHRLEVYRRETAELVPYYRDQGLLREVCGEGNVEDVHHRILSVLQPQNC
jgi:adenylate kinase